MPTSISEPSIYARKFASSNNDSDHLIAVAIFSGIGLLVSFIAVLFGTQGIWA
ncbi:hypothetical protein ACVWZ4_001813 [Bradyrhizobium sp. USDA 4472]